MVEVEDFSWALVVVSWWLSDDEVSVDDGELFNCTEEVALDVDVDTVLKAGLVCSRFGGLLVSERVEEVVLGRSSWCDEESGSTGAVLRDVLLSGDCVAVPATEKE